MKIAHIVEATATGTLSMVALSANIMASRGNDVIVIYSRRPETPADLAAHFDPAVRLHEIPLTGLSGLRGVAALRRLLKASGPEVVHLHSSFAGFWGRVALLGILPNASVLYSPHCISLMRASGIATKLCCYFLERVATIARSCLYVACSESERRVVERWLGARVALLENAVEEAGQSHDYPTQYCARRTVVTVGGIRGQKGPSLFSTIARSFAITHPDVSFRWIGDGDAALRAELEAAGVTVTGWKDRASVRNELRESTAYLSTSKWEGMPVSVIEAMALGKVVVASTCPGNVDVVDHGRSGLLFESAETACRMLAECVDSSTVNASLSGAAMAEVERRFTTARYANGLEQLYRVR